MLCDFNIIAANENKGFVIKKINILPSYSNVNITKNDIFQYTT